MSGEAPSASCRGLTDGSGAEVAAAAAVSGKLRTRAVTA
jgi:hypothetical protein